jgi:methionyl-tRNA synthetase
MALDIAPPKRILTHAHWTLGRQKMAKSTGNVVNPFFAIDRFGVDTVRYYMAHDGGIRDDADYENQFVVDRYKKDLSGGLGNLLSRITRGKGWDVRRAVSTNSRAHEDIFVTSKRAVQRQKLVDLPGIVAQKFDMLDSGAALREIIQVIYHTNSYLQGAAPWDLVKDPKRDKEVDEIIYLCAESLRICGILLQPYMPSKMKSLLDILGVHEDKRMFSDAVLGGDFTYGAPLPGVSVGQGLKGVLFPPLTTEF